MIATRAWIYSIVAVALLASIAVGNDVKITDDIFWYLYIPAAGVTGLVIHWLCK
jgi:hypothetical protein